MKPAIKPLIVVVDDDHAHIDILAEVLSGKNYQVETATNLADARALIRMMRPNLLILDRNLPDGDGIELCKEIRQDPKRSGTPILFLSVKNQVTEMVLGLGTGADDYLPKPFGMEELLARVTAILRRASRSPGVPGIVKTKPESKKTARKK